jgi:hypothetical protein
VVAQAGRGGGVEDVGVVPGLADLAGRSVDVWVSTYTAIAAGDELLASGQPHLPERSARRTKKTHARVCAGVSNPRPYVTYMRPCLPVGVTK